MIEMILIRNIHLIPFVVSLWIRVIISQEKKSEKSEIQSLVDSQHPNCDFHHLSPVIYSILCAVELNQWIFPKELSDYKYLGCLLDDNPPNRWNRCISPKQVPTEVEISKSPPPPEAKMKEYQKLAMTAEGLVPKIWWREGYANDPLLLSHNVTELPKRLLSVSSTRNKKLKNMLACVTRQVFIRESYSFSSSSDGSKCSDIKVIKKFYELWIQGQHMLAGIFINKNGFKIWQPSLSDNGNFLMAAIEAFDYFSMSYGGIWQGCFGLKEDGYCRGGLAAAAMVISVNYMSEIVTKVRTSSVSNLIAGYMLASLGRGLLHGEKKYTGNTPITAWKVTLNDFIALQSAYLKLYIDGIGYEYTRQLEQFIPMSFPPSFHVHAKPDWKSISYKEFEPVYTSLRNLMFTEAQILIDFGPYRPLVAWSHVRQSIKLKNQRRILIDIGANGFFASPKYLLDSYAPYIPFTDAIMVEPEPHFSASIPKSYSDRYNITFHQVYAEVGTGSETDMLKLLPKIVTKNDFVVLKFDVDPNRHAQGPTMEWGFLFSLMSTKQIAELIDELYIELHFYYPQLYWNHYHSNWEALDAIRYLRKNGVIVHAWP